MKYSEYIRFIASKLTVETPYICIAILREEDIKKSPHANRLLKTIHTKLKRANHSTLSYLSKCITENNVSARVEWLETLAKIHENKGN